MAKNYTQVEVLLLTGTSFLAGNWIRKNDDPATRHLSDMEKLQDACWNGLLEAMLPEVWIQPANDGILYLWDIREEEACLELMLGEMPLPVDPRLSISPQSFMGFQQNN